MENVTYAQLDAFLRSLGFHVREVDGKTRVYNYPRSEAYFTLPLFPPTEQAARMHIGGAMAVLDAYGIVKAEDFKARLLKAG